MEPRRLLVLNALLGALACLLTGGLVREIASARPLPPSPPARLGRPAGPPAPAPVAPPPVAAYAVVTARNLFSPGRSEVVTPLAPAVVGPKPVLHGVVLDGRKSRAYLEEPSAKRVLGYSVGDELGGGQVKTIGPDRVVITRADGSIEVLLRDPTKPRPTGPPPGALVTPPGAPVAATASAGASTPAPPPEAAAPSQFVRRDRRRNDD